jgi:hypothetical protein
MEIYIEATKKEFAMLDKKKFVDFNFDQLQVGDIVLSFTATNSQKYLIREGYEDYNMEKIGILLEKNEDDPQNSTILAYDRLTKTFSETNFYRNPGTSGIFYLQKYVK